MGVLPKTVVILGVIFFLLLVDPPVSGLKCYRCAPQKKSGSGSVGEESDAVNGTGLNSTINLNIGFGQGKKGRRAKVECTGEEHGEPITCEESLGSGGMKAVCFNRTLSTEPPQIIKGCVSKPPNAPLKCSPGTHEGTAEVKCYCDKDLCNGGSLKEGFHGLLSFLGVISLYKLN